MGSLDRFSINRTGTIIFESMDSKNMWDGLKTMSGMKKQTKEIPIEKGKEQEYAQDLNKFYTRFDTYDFFENIKKYSK